MRNGKGIKKFTRAALLCGATGLLVLAALLLLPPGNAALAAMEMPMKWGAPAGFGVTIGSAGDNTERIFDLSNATIEIKDEQGSIVEDDLLYVFYEDGTDIVTTEAKLDSGGLYFFRLAIKTMPEEIGQPYHVAVSIPYTESGAPAATPYSYSMDIRFEEADAADTIEISTADVVCPDAEKLKEALCKIYDGDARLPLADRGITVALNGDDILAEDKGNVTAEITAVFEDAEAGADKQVSLVYRLILTDPYMNFYKLSDGAKASMEKQIADLEAGLTGMIYHNFTETTELIRLRKGTPCFLGEGEWSFYTGNWIDNTDHTVYMGNRMVYATAENVYTFVKEK